MLEEGAAKYCLQAVVSAALSVLIVFTALWMAAASEGLKLAMSDKSAVASDEITGAQFATSVTAELICACVTFVQPVVGTINRAQSTAMRLVHTILMRFLSWLA